MKVELAINAAKAAITEQAEAMTSMMKEVSDFLQCDNVDSAYRRMNYELAEAFGKNLETLASEIE